MTERECGTCTACCTTTQVLPFGKAPGVRCPHLLGQGSCGSCSVYQDRPSCCRVYRCAWLAGDVPEEHKPDQCGVVAEILTKDGKPFLVDLSVAPGFLKHNRSVRDVVRYWRDRGVAILFDKALHGSREQLMTLANCEIRFEDGAKVRVAPW